MIQKVNNRIIQLLTFFFFLTAIYNPTNTFAQSKSDFNNAVKLLNNFKSEISNMRNAAKSPLGPYPLNAKYTWCSERAWWGFGTCTRTKWEKFTWSVNFSWIKGNLNSVLSSAESNANTFTSSFAPTQQWINNLPQFSQEFTKNAQLIESIGAEISRGVGPNDGQKNTVTNALQQLINDLNASQKLLQQGTSSLTAFLQRQSSYRAQIKSTMDQLPAKQQEELNKAKATARKTCTQQGTFDKLTSVFNGIQNDFNNSTNSINSAFQKLDSSSRNAEKGVAAILSTVITNSGDLSSILKNVKEAKTSELGSWIQEMNLGIAQEQWQKLAKNM